MHRYVRLTNHSIVIYLSIYLSIYRDLSIVIYLSIYPDLS